MSRDFTMEDLIVAQEEAERDAKEGWFNIRDIMKMLGVNSCRSGHVRAYIKMLVENKYLLKKGRGTSNQTLYKVVKLPKQEPGWMSAVEVCRHFGYKTSSGGTITKLTREGKIIKGITLRRFRSGVLSLCVSYKLVSKFMPNQLTFPFMNEVDDETSIS